LLSRYLFLAFYYERAAITDGTSEESMEVLYSKVLYFGCRDEIWWKIKFYLLIVESKVMNKYKHPGLPERKSILFFWSFKNPKEIRGVIIMWNSEVRRTYLVNSIVADKVPKKSFESMGPILRVMICEQGFTRKFI